MLSKSAEALLVLTYRLSSGGVEPVSGEEVRRLFGEGFNRALLELLRADCIAHAGRAGTIALSDKGRQEAWSRSVHGAARGRGDKG